MLKVPLKTRQFYLTMFKILKIETSMILDDAPTMTYFLDSFGTWPRLSNRLIIFSVMTDTFPSLMTDTAKTGTLM